MDGLWIHPFVRHPESRVIEPRIRRIRVRNGNERFVKKELELQFEHLPLVSPRRVPFNKTDSVKGILLFERKYHYDGNTDKTKNSLVPYEDGFCEHVGPKGFSNSFLVPVDSLLQHVDAVSMIRIVASCRYQTQNTGTLVVVLEGGAQPESYMNYFEPSGIGNWYRSEIDKRFPSEVLMGSQLRVYVWNNGNEPIRIDDLKVRISMDDDGR